MLTKIKHIIEDNCVLSDQKLTTMLTAIQGEIEQDLISAPLIRFFHTPAISPEAKVDILLSVIGALMVSNGDLREYIFSVNCCMKDQPEDQYKASVQVRKIS